MLRKAIAYSVVIPWFLLAGNVAAAESTPYLFYFGMSGGYGWTTWEGLVPPPNRQNMAMTMSTPKYVTEGGGLWGVFLGYELLPSFAIEGAYFHYPTATVNFDPNSIFSFDNGGLSQFDTKTETVSLLAKIMMSIPQTKLRAYSGIGIAEVHRADQLNDHWITSPTFAIGFNYPIVERVMAELGANYTAGRGESELNPVQDYFPFLYSVYFRLAYRV